MDDVLGLNLHGDAHHWALDVIEPTTLILPWPESTAPRPEDVCKQLHIEGEYTVIASDDSSVVWSIAVHLPGADLAAALWCEMATEGAIPNELDAGEQATRWVLGIQTELDADDPLTSYWKLLRHLAVALPDVGAVLDVNCSAWHDQSELRSVLGHPEVEPPAEVMWIIHVVAAAEDPDASTWLHTHGLHRCGRPELEMLQVPARHAPMAAQLLNQVATLLLGTAPPAPGEPIEIASELNIVLQPWQDLVPKIASGPGSMDDRAAEDDAHRGVRAVVCDAAPHDDDEMRWQWPQHVIQHLEAGDVPIFVSPRATRRQAAAAQGSWEDLCHALERLPETEQSQCLVKAGFGRADSSEHGEREHLWFDATAVRGDCLEATLLSEPRWVELEGDESRTVRREQLTDWQIILPTGRYGPDQRLALRAALDAEQGSI